VLLATISANIAASMAISREKKHLGWLDWFVIVLLTAVWTVTVYQVATAGIPAGLCIPPFSNPYTAHMVCDYRPKHRIYMGFFALWVVRVFS
jgi:hypothetical protein